MPDKRFKIKATQGIFNAGKIIVDSETGVNYLFWAEGYAGGLTPLLNKDGTPIITREDE